MIRRLLPPKLKLQIRLFQRSFSDWRNRTNLPLAISSGTLNGVSEVVVQQMINRAHLFENKVHNLQTAARRIEQVVIRPGEVFSFWKIVGNPSGANGYRTGRNIVNGKLQEATGGGLCQLSGIIYHASLLAGLNVVERYNHTVDIYREEDRFTPLGSDATVVYGYKDLRVQNLSGSAIRFAFSIAASGDAGGTIICKILSDEPLPKKTLTFERHEYAGKRIVVTMNGNQEKIAESHYIRPNT
jgi:vancomycin resistance protein VanW